MTRNDWLNVALNASEQGRIEDQKRKNEQEKAMTDIKKPDDDKIVQRIAERRGLPVLTDAIIDLVAKVPGLTAWQITVALSESPMRDKGTISSLMCRLAGVGRLRRNKNKKGSWTYRPIKEKKS